jgi:hypothetical protein
MTIEKGLVSHIESYVEVQAYLLALPQDVELPAIRYQRITTPRALTLDQTNSGLAMSTFQFDVYAETYDDIVTITEDIHSAFDGYTGLLDDTKVYAILPDGERDDYEPELKLFRKILDFMIYYEE